MYDKAMWEDGQSAHFWPLQIQGPPGEWLAFSGFLLSTASAQRCYSFWEAPLRVSKPALGLGEPLRIHRAQRWSLHQRPLMDQAALAS